MPNEIVLRSRTRMMLRRTSSMNAFTPLCTACYEQVKAFFTSWHGHQSKSLAMFVLGAIRAESDAKASSIERRWERFLSNDRIETEKRWNDLLDEVMPFFRGKPMRLIVDVTAYEEHAQVIYIGLLQHTRVLPLVWKVMPGQEKWEQGFWACLEELF